MIPRQDYIIYNPEFCRMLNADDTDVLTSTLADLTDKNLFSYCDNNPAMREDSDGDFWGFALAGGGALGASWSLGGANFWNPVGWVVLGVATVATIGYGGYEYYKSKQNKISYSNKNDSQTVNSPIGSANRKQQGREVNEKKRKNKNFESRSNKNSNRGMKKHTPSRKGHKKY
ncbi:hypothetical protein [Clostridium sp. UBA4548]|uniref:hypothetical protein n=1 Tax=Clostridium sp. UBA4548 TaxID=1946361 RepID=UPI0025C5BAEB|nr:hypothetical protein [Clostridium sp. UBA4548]